MLTARTRTGQQHPIANELRGLSYSTIVALINRGISTAAQLSEAERAHRIPGPFYPEELATIRRVLADWRRTNER